MCFPNGSIYGNTPTSIKDIYGKTNAAGNTNPLGWGGSGMRWGSTDPSTNFGYAQKNLPGMPYQVQEQAAGLYGTPWSSNPMNYGRWNWIGAQGAGMPNPQYTPQQPGGVPTPQPGGANPQMPAAPGPQPQPGQAQPGMQSGQAQPGTQGGDYAGMGQAGGMQGYGQAVPGMSWADQQQQSIAAAQGMPQGDISKFANSQAGLGGASLGGTSYNPTGGTFAPRSIPGQVDMNDPVARAQAARATQMAAQQWGTNQIGGADWGRAVGLLGR